MAFQLADLFEIVAAEVPERLALVAGDARHTYRELDELTDRFADAIDRAGVGAGDSVGIFATNSAEVVVVMLGAWKRRAVPVVVNARASARELDEIADDAGFALLVCDQAHSDVVRDASVSAALGDRIVTIEGDLPRLLHDAQPVKRFAPRSNDDHYVLYTGGTTGRPKGVVWRHEDIFQAATAGGNPGGPPITAPEELARVVRVNRASRIAPFLPPGDAGPDQFVSLSLGPLSHASGQWGMFGTLLAGGTLVLYTRSSIDMAHVLELVQRERITMLTLVGDASARPLLDELDAHPGRYDTSSLRLFGSGGTILTASVKRRLLDVVPTALAILEAVGASESPSQAVAVLTRDATVGASLTFTPKPDSMIVDDELRPVPRGTVGRLATAGPVPIGYHSDPLGSARTFVEIEGRRWSIPGDLAYIGDDEMLHLVGRGSLCINSGGEKVYPEEVEAVLKTHTGVRDAAVVGVTEDRWGQLVTAVVAPAHGSDPPALDDLRAHCRASLAAYKAPRAIVLVGEVARSSAGKLDYPWARDRAAGITDGEVRDARADLTVDAVVVGGGGAGTAAACALARRGRSVWVVDRYPTGHVRGSSHGTERIFRYAYAEAEFVELAIDARPRWSELETLAGEQLLVVNGGIDIGPPAHIDALAHALADHGVPFDLLDNRAARAHVPELRVADMGVGAVALWQPDGAVIRADRALGAFRSVAERAGATFVDGDAVRSIQVTDDGDAAFVETESGRVVRSDVAIVTAGAWTAPLLAGLSDLTGLSANVTLPPIAVTQEQVGFFRPRGDVGALPTFIVVSGDTSAAPVYGLATPTGLVKVAEHGSGPVVDPDTRSFAVEPTRWRALLDWVRAYMPGVDPEPVDATTCLYATAPDDRFVFERSGPIIVGAGLGGHAFKFLPSIGARLADLAEGRS